MKKILFIALVCCMMNRCEFVENNNASDATVKPVASHIFEVEPTEEQIQSFLAQSRQSYASQCSANVQKAISTVSGNSIVLAAGIKEILLKVKTKAGSSYGTDDPAYFGAVWTFYGGSYRDEFLLDYASSNDLESGSYQLFYYVITPKKYNSGITVSADVLNRCWIRESGTDGWYCEYITVYEANYLGNSRTNLIYFNTVVDYPSCPMSDYFYPSDTSSLVIE